MSVVVVGYDTWTEAVINRLQKRDIEYTVLVTDRSVSTTLTERDIPVVYTATITEAAFAEADITDATAVLVATLDERQNVLAVLTAADVTTDTRIVTYASEQVDAAKLRRAGADTVVNIGPVTAELLVQAATNDMDPGALLEQLLDEDQIIETAADIRQTAQSAAEE